jgi:hypothetical protein
LDAPHCGLSSVGIVPPFAMGRTSWKHPNLSGVAGDYECRCNMWTSLDRHEGKTGVHCCEGRVFGGGWPAETTVGAFQGDGAGVCVLESARHVGAIEELEEE